MTSQIGTTRGRHRTIHKEPFWPTPDWPKRENGFYRITTLTSFHFKWAIQRYFSFFSFYVITSLMVKGYTGNKRLPRNISSPYFDFVRKNEQLSARWHRDVLKTRGRCFAKHLLKRQFLLGTPDLANTAKLTL